MASRPPSTSPGSNPWTTEEDEPIVPTVVETVTVESTTAAEPLTQAVKESIIASGDYSEVFAAEDKYDLSAEEVASMTAAVTEDLKEAAGKQAVIDAEDAEADLQEARTKQAREQAK